MQWDMYVIDAIVLLALLLLTLVVWGMIRLPNPLAKMHATTLGMVTTVVVLFSAPLFAGVSDLAWRGVLVAAFLLLTAPLGAHALAQLQARIHEDERN